MSTPETPPQNPMPDAADALKASEPVALSAPAQPISNGHADAASAVATTVAPADAVPENASPSPSHGEGEGEGHDSSDDEGGDGAPEGAAGESPTPAGGPAAAGAAGEKKRRRRRRKKKPGQAAVEGAAPAVAEAGDTEASEEGSEDAKAGPTAHKGDTGPRRKENKDKRTGPPRERPPARPPVNGGDIVFGKILEITDDAILIDIPGKAYAIFDRREMLLPDDEEQAQAAPRPPSPPLPEAVKTDADVAAAPGESIAGELETGAQSIEAAPTATPDGETAAAVDEGAPEAAPIAAPAPTKAPDASLSAEPEPMREPKVPRVILEVGADFIGVVYNDGARGGLVVLTHHPNRAEKAKPIVEKAFNEKGPVDGLVTGVIKGGVEVDIDGLRAFAPGSHVDLRLGTDLSYLVGKRLPFFVTQYAKRGRDVVLSRRSLLEEESKRSRSDALAKLKVGEDIDGTVRSVVPFGAFVDIGGIEGLVPLQEMSHNRADGPADVFKVGETTRVKVLKIDEKGKIWLSRKATMPDPWQQVAKKYATGTRHAGKVVRLQPFGAFVELESGVDGLIHLADLSIRRIELPDEVAKVGDAIEVVVSHVDPLNHKIALHPAPQGDAANETPQRVQPHKPIKAKVVTIEAGGLVVRILGVTGRNARGYVTAAGTGTPRGTELRKVFTVGQEVEAKVIELDPRRGEVKLSIKALGEDQERNAYQQYRQQLKAEARFTFGDLLAKKVTPSR